MPIWYLFTTYLDRAASDRGPYCVLVLYLFMELSNHGTIIPDQSAACLILVLSVGTYNDHPDTHECHAPQGQKREQSADFCRMFQTKTREPNGGPQWQTAHPRLHQGGVSPPPSLTTTTARALLLIEGPRSRPRPVPVPVPSPAAWTSMKGKGAARCR